MAIYHGNGAANQPILQVAQGYKTAKGYYDPSSITDFDDISLSVSITPQSTSNKVLIMYTVHTSTNGATTNTTRLYRNNTRIAEGASSGNRTTINGMDASSNSAWATQIHMQWLDSPSTTSAITYKVYVGNHDGRSMTVNSSYQDSNDNYGDNARPISTIIAMEIEG